MGVRLGTPQRAQTYIHQDPLRLEGGANRAERVRKWLGWLQVPVVLPRWPGCAGASRLRGHGSCVGRAGRPMAGVRFGAEIAPRPRTVVKALRLPQCWARPGGATLRERTGGAVRGHGRIPLARHRSDAAGAAGFGWRVATQTPGAATSANGQARRCGGARPDSARETPQRCGGGAAGFRSRDTAAMRRGRGRIPLARGDADAGGGHILGADRMGGGVAWLAGQISPLDGADSAGGGALRLLGLALRTIAIYR